MANKFLDLLGLSEFLNQLKALFVTKNEIGMLPTKLLTHI